MAVPSTREAFKNYCLRRLGEPVIDVNVDDEQVEDRIDEALKYYQDYHFDGTERVLIKHVVTAADVTNGYITLSDSVIGINRILDVGQAVQSSNLFNIRYQIHLNDLFDLSASSYVPYVTAMRHVESLEELFVGKKPIRYNRHTNRLHIDMDWDNDVETGEYIIVDAYQILDGDTYTELWGDRWLARYTTALIKRQWGSNLTKFEGLQMPGGVTFNGAKIYDDAESEIQKLEEEMIVNYSLPVQDMIG
jgi:chloramphenicol 3-O-phosphotransferase